MRTLTHILLAASIMTATGCTGESATVGVGHSGVGYSKSTSGPVDLSGIDVRRIGNDQVRLREFQDRAIANSIAHLGSQGIERERIKSVTVDTIGGESGGSLSIGHPFGATGARMVTTMANELARSGKETALLGICAAGGLGAGAVLEAV